jgi:hypothetical protein
MNKLAVLGLCALGVAGCAGREAHPVAVMQDYDKNMACEQIRAEIRANEVKAQQLAGEGESARTANVVVGTVGVLLFWPALFALNLSDAERQEMTALSERNTHLATLADMHGCNNPAPPPAQQASAPPPAAAAPAATTQVTGPSVHWIGQAYRDGCGKPYAIDVAVANGWVKGHLRRDNADYLVDAQLDPSGNLNNSLVSLASAASVPDTPGSISLKINFSEQDATGGFSTFDGKVYSCTTALTLEKV